MVFEEIIHNSPRRRASPWLAEGFTPTARGAYERGAAALRPYRGRGGDAPLMVFE
jgi:hypothetical protein